MSSGFFGSGPELDDDAVAPGGDDGVAPGVDDDDAALSLTVAVAVPPTMGADKAGRSACP